MKFDLLYEELMKQTEFDFNNKLRWLRYIPIELQSQFKNKYYPIINMREGRGKNAALNRFWSKVRNEIKIPKSIIDKNEFLISLGFPEHRLHRNH